MRRSISSYFYSPVSTCTAILFLILLAGCSLTPKYTQPEISYSDKWSENGTEKDAINLSRFSDEDFWKSFRNEELTLLVNEGLKNNYDLKAAIRRVEQARAQVRIAGAGLYPQVSASGDVSYSVEKPDGRELNGIDSSSAGLDISYELDLWGGIRAGRNSALASFQASEFDYQALALVLKSDVASAYIQALALQDRIKVTRQNYENSLKILDIIEARFREGLDTALEVAQQRTEIANTESTLISLEQSLKTTLNQLAILEGKAPQDFSIERQSLSSLSLPSIAPEQPSSLLQRRPDLKSAEASLRAANADIGVARAELYPSINLGLSPVLAASSPVTNLTSMVLSMAASLYAPIFQGGELEGQVQLSEARKEELVETYLQSILAAFNETEDALVATKSSSENLKATETAADQANLSYKLAEALYKEGAADFINLLQAQVSMLQTEDNLVQARLAQYQAALDLYKAMGGGWASNPADM